MINIWAHRGCSYRYPENTLSAFREALQYDITGMELDIQLTKDREIVVIHDETVDRTTDHTGLVNSFTLAELKTFRIRGDENERIPTMREVFELVQDDCKRYGIKINIELKNSEIRYEGMEEMILAMTKEYGMQDHVIYSSFNPESCAMLKKMDPSLHVGVLAGKVSECLQIAEDIGADALHPYIHMLDLGDLRSRTALPVRAWNVKEFEPFYPDEGELEIQDTEALAKAGVTDIFTNAPEEYVPKRGTPFHPEEYEMYDNTGADGATGKLIPEENCSINREPVKLKAGDRLFFLSTELPQIYFYSEDIQQDLIYTYTYDTEGNWTSYQDNYPADTNDYTVEKSGYYRFLYHGHTGRTLADLIRFEKQTDIPEWPEYFQKECRESAGTVKSLRQPGDSVYLLLSDTHYAAGCVWDDSVLNMKMLSRVIHPDGVIHLGDLTDGNMPKKQTRRYAGRVLGGLRSLGIPLYMCTGNHDRNAFRGNPEKYTAAEAASVYLHRSKQYYYQDIHERKLRMIFLDSFDPDEKERYGFSAAQVWWLFRTLYKTPKNYRVLVFSHVTVNASHHVWSKTIRNEEKVTKILQRYQKKTGRILALIHGHNHAEEIYSTGDIPVVSLGCNKLEYFTDHKPETSFTSPRQRHTVTQELFDILIVHRESNILDLVRFGAGEDRRVGI